MVTPVRQGSSELVWQTLEDDGTVMPAEGGGAPTGGGAQTETPPPPLVATPVTLTPLICSL